MAGVKAFFAKLTASKAGLAATILGSVVIVGGVAAGVYYGIVVPNKPENVLKSSVKNLVNQDQISGKGQASVSAKDSMSVTADYSLQSDKTKQATAGTFDISVSGVKLPIEFRMIDQNAYVKVGNLDTIKGLAAGFGGEETAQAVGVIADKVSNKWIEFDKSLLNTTLGKDCDPLRYMSQDEINQIMSLYEQNSFVTIKNTSEDTIDNKKVTKYELGIDQQKAKEFGTSLNQVEAIKRLDKCGKNSEDTTKAAEDFKGNVELTVWVDKGAKEIKKIGLNVDDDEGSLEADFVFNNDPVNIEKPEDAVPAMQLLSQLSPVLGANPRALQSLEQ